MIPFDRLKAEIKEVTFDTVRTYTDTYFEAVVSRDNLSSLISRLEKAFGIAVWPPNNKLPAKIVEAIKDFGGVMEGQTLYFCSQESSCVFAMLWPWQDGKSITLKLAVK